jgi:hypothetical protein
MASSVSRVMLFSSTGEATWGSTAGAATRKLHGVEDASLTIAKQVDVVRNVGWIGPSAVSAEVSQSGEGEVSGTVCYEEFPSLLNGMFTAIGASATTAAPYTYQYTAPTTSTQACYTYCIEYGTSTSQAFKSLGSIITGMNIKGEAPGFWKFSTPFVSKQIINATGGLTTAANVARTVNPIKMATTVLSIDPFSTGTFGGTPVTATLISFELDVPAGRHTKLFAGSKFPGAWGDGEMNGTLSMTMEFNSTVEGYVDAMLGSTGTDMEKHIRLYATEGTSSARTCTIDFAGIQNEPVKTFSDRDGNCTLELKFAGKNSTGLASGNWLQCTVVMGSSSTT